MEPDKVEHREDHLMSDSEYREPFLLACDREPAREIFPVRQSVTDASPFVDG